MESGLRRRLDREFREEVLRIYRYLALIAILLSVTITVPLGAQDESQEDLPTVAVLDFTGFMLGQGGQSMPLGKAVSAMLITELSDREGLRVIERSRLQDILQEQRLALSGRVDEGTAVQVGKLVGAQYIIHGAVTAIAGQMRMDMQAVDVETSEILEVQKLSDTTDALLEMVVQMADLFDSKLDLAPPSERPDIAPIPVMATVAFSRGVDYEDKGEREQAVEQYRRALELYPDYKGATQALTRLAERGGDV